MDRTSTTYRRIARALEALFLALLGLYLAYSVERITTFRVRWPGAFEPGLRIALAVVAVARLPVSGLRRREMLIAAAMALIYCLVYRSDGYVFLLYLASLTVGCAGIDYRKILKTYLVAVGAVFFAAMVAGLLGVITNYVSSREGRGVRSAWGLCYYTDFASLALYLLMTLWVAQEKLPDWAMLFVCAGFMLLSGVVARSYTSFICGALFVCAILYCMFERAVIERRGKLRWLKKGVDLYVTAAFPLLALCMFAMMLLYARGTNAGYRLNDVLSLRLMYSVEMWQLHGVKAFGTPLEQNGYGFSVFPSNNFNFVDSTYPLILLRYGWVLFIATCLLWVWVARKAIRRGDRRLVLVMGLIAIHSFAEHHFLETHFNILAVMPLALFAAQAAAPEPAAVGRDVTPGDRRAGVLANVATALLLIAGICLISPAALPLMKTVLEYKHLGHGEHRLRLVCVMLAGVCGVCVLAWALSRLLKALIRRDPIRKNLPALVALVLCVAIGGGAWAFAGRIVDAAARDSAAMVEADREALEIAVGAGTGKVYSGVLPAVYGKSVEGLGRAVLFEDDLARLRGNTFLMSSDSERGVFFDCGCLYVPVSEGHAIYTGDRAVAEALAEAGYHVTGYYSDVREVDLLSAAEKSELAYDAAKGLRLDDAERPLWNGPFYNLFGGRYTVTWELKLPEGAPRDGVVCRLSVTSFRGENLLQETEAAGDQFDDEGRLSVPMTFEMGDSRNVAFQAAVAAGMRVDIAEIRFARTPYCDAHAFYDSKLRVIREEFYDLDGLPAVQPGGYYSYDQAYDRYGNVSRRWFYDANGVLTLREEGYAEVRWQYNARHQVVKEEYFGTDGQPILLPGGYASWEMEYDGSGAPVAQRYYGVSGEPVLNGEGYFEARWGYDGAGEVSDERYFDTQGAAVALP